MISYPSGYADTSDIGEPFQPGGDIDAIAEDIAVFDQHIAHVYPDAKVHPAVFGEPLVGAPHCLLDRHG